jgi:hypothetical protein
MRVIAAPIMSAACDCRDCQELTSGAYSLTLMIPELGLCVVSGEQIIGGLHRAELRRHFRPHCQNRRFTRGDVIPGFVTMRPAMLAESSWVAPFIETKQSIARRAPSPARSGHLRNGRHPAT